MFSRPIYSLTAAFAAMSILPSNVSATCGECWVPDTSAGASAGACKVQDTRVTLTCRGQNMELSVEKCVMGNTEEALLRILNNNAKAGCTMTADANDAALTHGDDPNDNEPVNLITESATHYNAKVSLDCADMVIVPAVGDVKEKIKFSQKLTAVLPADAADSIISFSNTNEVEFACAFDSDYEISDDFEVQASVTATQAVSKDDAKFDFNLNWHANQNFDMVMPANTVMSVGSTGYLAMEASLPSGFEFNTHTCEVRHATDAGKTYKIFENMCPAALTETVIHSSVGTTQNTFSYKIFEFRGASSNAMKMVCNTKVCQVGATDSPCHQTCAPAVGCAEGDDTCHFVDEWYIDPDLPHSRRMDAVAIGDVPIYEEYDLEFEINFRSWSSSHALQSIVSHTHSHNRRTPAIWLYGANGSSLLYRFMTLNGGGNKGATIYVSLTLNNWHKIKMTLRRATNPTSCANGTTCDGWAEFWLDDTFIHGGHGHIITGNPTRDWNIGWPEAPSGDVPADADIRNFMYKEHTE